MIYNLWQYLVTRFPAENIYINVVDKIFPDNQVPDRCVVLREGAGVRTIPFGLITKPVHCIVRDVDPPKARELAFLIYEELKMRLGVVLPQTSVNGQLFPVLQLARLSADGEPQTLGFDESGRVEFSTNFLAVWEE